MITLLENYTQEQIDLALSLWIIKSEELTQIESMDSENMNQAQIEMIEDIKEKMSTIKARQTIEFINEKEKEFDFQDTVASYIDYEELQEAIDNDTIYDFLNDLNDDRKFTDTEIIYYSNAIKYLQENDPSMQEAIEIASDYWYETKNLNSELLASLLATRNNEEDYSSFVDEVVEFLNDLE